MSVNTCARCGRRPNITRELLTVEDCIRAYSQKVGRNDTGRTHQLDS